MTIFSKVKKILDDEKACIITKNGAPQYIAMKWEKYQQIVDKIKKPSLNENKDDGDDFIDSDEIDINKIPV